MITIESLDSAGLARAADALADILHACVNAGASVSFIQPFSPADALAFWTGPVARALAGGGRRLLVARDASGRIVGTVQLDLDTPPNQAHRGEVAKMLVHPSARRQGIARKLMAALLDIARAEGRWLVTLDTRVNDAAQPLYASLGFELAGVIPHFARGAEHGSDRYDGTAYMYAVLDIAPRLTAAASASR